jgi:glycosyltransferase involved in cell wall biosynthesis
LRIAIVTWSRRRAGGVESYLQTVAAGLRGRGHDVALWHEVDAPADRPAIALPDGVPAWCAGGMGPERALAALRGWRPDLLYSHGTDSPELEAGTLTAAPGVFFVHSYYGTCISGFKAFKVPRARPCGRRFGPGCLLHYLPRRCGGWSPLTMWRQYHRQRARLGQLRRYAAVVTHSEHMRREYLRYGLPAERVAAYTDVADHDHAPEGDGPRVALPLVGEAPPPGGAEARLLFLGRMERLKGGDVLLDALPRVAAALGRPVRLSFAGAGPARAAWEARARRLQGRHPDVRVDFLGWVGRDALGGLFEAHDLLAVPSLWPEPYGLVGIEAGWCGLPAAAFAAGGIGDWLKDGVNGALAPADPPTVAGLADAVVRCLRDPAAHARLRRGAAELARRTRLAAHLDSLQGIFDRVLRNARPAPQTALVPTP